MLNEIRKRPIFLWLLGGGIAGAIITGVLLAIGLITRGSPLTTIETTPVLVVIPAPTTTPTSIPTSTTEIPVEEPTPTPFPLDAGEIFQGQLVEIYGTGGDGLRLRVQPGLDGRIAFLGVESEVFEVQGGPEDVDGYEWWFLSNPYNSEKTGWAVSIYLRSISSP